MSNEIRLSLVNATLIELLIKSCLDNGKLEELNKELKEQAGETAVPLIDLVSCAQNVLNDLKVETYKCFEKNGMSKKIEDCIKIEDSVEESCLSVC
jgi:hypothetical protein